MLFAAFKQPTSAALIRLAPFQSQVLADLTDNMRASTFILFIAGTTASFSHAAPVRSNVDGVAVRMPVHVSAVGDGIDKRSLPSAVLEKRGGLPAAGHQITGRQMTYGRRGFGGFGDIIKFLVPQALGITKPVSISGDTPILS
ncbi:hypothetical protein FA95DRAFT_1567809 [Auriscalpium vulgare]|uniref:Uncharacterized protein n=1 Tax=Auriscalpium vulgare TaxID=40419 RepID=A0ACB8R364_9AGAM|nr:hypothetical protein FA95DRAFT_1567809 [Auriscalpium vulgare]